MSKQQARIYPRLIGGRFPKYVKPVDWEVVDQSGLSAGVSRAVAVYKLEVDGTRYDLQLTKRVFYRESWTNTEPKGSCAFTITIWGWSHNDVHHSPSIGRSFRWKDHESINGRDFALKMEMNDPDADAILGLLMKLGHPVSSFANQQPTIED